MKQNNVRLFLLGGAVLLLLFALLLPSVGPAPALLGDTVSPSAALHLSAALVHGEAAQLRLHGIQPGVTFTLSGSDAEHVYHTRFRNSPFANGGLCLYQLPAAVYAVYADGRRIDASLLNDSLPQGYTLPRDGLRKHWQFRTDRHGLLELVIRDTEHLPAGYFDVAIDAGHGGGDLGAEAGGEQEAQLNLENSLLLKSYLEAHGLRVFLTREDAALPGGMAAEENPYLPNARIDLIYRSHASYLISNHLNAGNGQQAGFQIYSSVASDLRFATAVADALLAAGAVANDSGSGLVANGLYQRHSEEPGGYGRDYYFILRETGGAALSPTLYLYHNPQMADAIQRGPEALLMEYAFLDNAADRNAWLQQRETLLQATAAGAAAYWQL